MKEQLLDKIKNKEIHAGVIGLGYVGLPLAVEIAKAGYDTIGFDIVPEKVHKINAGENYISDVSDKDLQQLVACKKLTATNDFKFIEHMDFVAICVPTPLDLHQQPDITYVKNSVEQIGKYLKPGTMVVLESTTYPGTTTEIAKPILEQFSTLVCGKDFYLAFSPERIDPGNIMYSTKNTPKVVGGIGSDATNVISAMYRNVLDAEILEVSGPEVAEMGKILENTYRNINVGLINELAMLCEKMNINIWEVIEVAKTKPYGFQACYPGPGLGGHCIPIDPYYLTWKAREYGFHTSMIESAMMINDRMPEYCAQRAMDILNRDGIAMNTAKILILGIAYKSDINDYRESPALTVIQKLLASGANIDYYDPYIFEYEKNGNRYIGLPSIDESSVSGYDLVIITTGHSNVNYEMIQKNAKRIFDVRNAMKNITTRDNIELL